MSNGESDTKEVTAPLAMEGPSETEGKFIPRYDKNGGAYTEDQLTIARLERAVVLLKRDAEYLLSLSTMKDMGKKILGLREANRSLTRVLVKKVKIINQKSTRIVGDQKELEVLRDRACDSYGNISTNIGCEHCIQAVRQYCNLLSLSIKEKEAKRKAHHNGK